MRRLLNGILGVCAILAAAVSLPAYAHPEGRVGPSAPPAFNGELGVNLQLDGTIIPNTGLSVPSWTEGQLWYDNDNKTWTLDTNVPATRIQLAQEGMIRVTNKTGVQIDDGRPIYLNGAQGGRATIALAKADATATSRLVALTTHDCADNDTCFVTIWGEVRDIDTTGTPYSEVWAEGDEIYLSAATAGNLTNVMPAAPNFTVIVGIVETAHASTGKLLVKIFRDSGVPDPIVPADGTQNLTGDLTVSGDVVATNLFPQSDNAGVIGTGALTWNTVRATNIRGTTWRSEDDAGVDFTDAVGIIVTNVAKAGDVDNDAMGMGTLYEADSSTTLTVAVQNTWYHLCSGTAGATSQNVTISTAPTCATAGDGDTITVTNAGDYKITFGASYTGPNLEPTQGCVMVNNTCNDECRFSRTMSAAASIGDANVPGCTITLSASDVVEGALRSTDASPGNFTVSDWNLSLDRIDP